VFDPAACTLRHRAPYGTQKILRRLLPGESCRVLEATLDALLAGSRRFRKGLAQTLGKPLHCGRDPCSDR